MSVLLGSCLANLNTRHPFFYKRQLCDRWLVAASIEVTGPGHAWNLGKAQPSWYDYPKAWVILPVLQTCCMDRPAELPTRVVNMHVGSANQVGRTEWKSRFEATSCHSNVEVSPRNLWKLQSLRTQFSYKVKDVMILPQLSHSVCPHPLVNLFSTTATHQNHTAIFITMCACVPRTHSERNTKDHNLWLACRLLRQVAQFVTYTYTLPKDTFILFKEWNKVKFWDLKKYGYKKQPFK